MIGDQLHKQNKIGHYLLGKTIGEGTFGKVKLATHTLTQEKVAIKILVKSKIIDVADVERVSREIHILKLIRHPNIIQLYEIIETTKHLFLVMEYIEKGQLFDYIVKENCLKEKQACKFFKHIISGIAYLHELNIVHRDLKPENLLIDWKDTLKIVDFGLSNTYKAGELLKTACGSPCYAAPQMISSKKYNGLEVDIWSSGVILFAMVCGYLPFQDSNTAQLYKKILSGEYTLPDFISEQFKDLIEKILNVNPSKRYRLEEIFNHKWCDLIQDIPFKSGIVVGYHRIPVDKQIVAKLSQFNFDLEYAERCIEANKHNHITTTYYLLLKKESKQGYKSKSDINSSIFDYSAIEPFKKVSNPDKKYFFFDTKEQSPLIKLDNIDINIKHRDPNLSLKPYTSKFHSKKQEKLHNLSTEGIQKNPDKGKKMTEYFSGAKKFKDLQMYIKPQQNRKKDFYSESKQRQDRRHNLQSLYEQRNRSKDENHIVIRTQTQYSQDKRSSFSRTKYARSQKKKLANKISFDKSK